MSKGDNTPEKLSKSRRAASCCLFCSCCLPNLRRSTRAIAEPASTHKSSVRICHNKPGSLKSFKSDQESSRGPDEKVDFIFSVRAPQQKTRLYGASVEPASGNPAFPILFFV